MLAENLIRFRKKLKLTQEEVAGKLNISLLTLLKYEKGSKDPNIFVLCRLADFYQVSLDELVGRTWKQPSDTIVYFTDDEVEMMERAVKAKCHRLEKGLEYDRESLQLPIALWQKEWEVCQEIMKKLAQSKAIEG